MGRCAGPWHELRLPVPSGNGTGCSAGGWKRSATGDVTALCLSTLQKWKKKIPKQRKQREKSSISRVKTNTTFFCSFRENCVSLREIVRGGMSAGLRGRMGQICQHHRICKHHRGPHLQSPPPSPWVSGRPCHVYLQQQSELAARWASAGAPGSCSPVNVWPWLPSVSTGLSHTPDMPACATRAPPRSSGREKPPPGPAPLASRTSWLTQAVQAKRGL